MIKLKDLIIERRPSVSKENEGYALQVIKVKLLPGVVNIYNYMAKTKWNVPQITLNEARKQLRKINVEHFTNGQAIEYGIKLPGTTILFKIQRLSFKKDHGDATDKETYEVGYYNFLLTGLGESSWNMYDVKGLSAGDYDTVTDPCGDANLW